MTNIHVEKKLKSCSAEDTSANADWGHAALKLPENYKTTRTRQTKQTK